MDKRKIIQLVLSTIFTIILIWIILLIVPLNSLIHALNLVGIKFIIIGFILHLFTYLIRTIMLYMLLKNAKITFSLLLSIHFIQNFFVHLIPASLGELSFPFLMKRKVNMSTSLSAILLTKLSIMTSLSVLFLISVFIVLKGKISFDIELPKIIILASIIFAFLCLGWAIFRIRNYALIKKILSAISKLKNSLAEDLKKFKDIKFSFIFILLTLISNFFLAYFYISILEGMNVHLSFWQSIFIASIGIAFLILPLKSIGGFGTSEGSWAIGMVLLGFDKITGVQTGFVAHIFALLNVTLLFIVGVLINFCLMGASKEKLM